MEDVIITGLETRHRTYTRAAAGGHNDRENAPVEEKLTLERQVTDFLQSKNITIESKSIAACHTLPRKDSRAKPAIIIRFVNRKYKTQLLMQGKNLKGSDVYERASNKKNANIARQARNLRKQNKIKATWTRNCKVMIRLNGATPEEARAITVRDRQDLDQYK